MAEELEENKKNPPRKVKPDKQVKSAAEQLIYAGPVIQGGVLAQYTVFRGELPAHIEKLASDRPEIKELIIPISELSTFIKRAAEKGTAEYRAYESAKGVK